MKKGIKFKIFFGISALSFASSFCVRAALPSVVEKRTINEQTVYKEKDDLKKEYSGNFQRKKNGLISVKKVVKKTLSIAAMMTFSYAVGATIGLLTAYLTDKMSMKFFNFKITDYLKDLWKDV